MRPIQNILRIVGAMALGTTLGYIAVIVLGASMAVPGQERWQVGLGQFLGGLFCGAPLGVVAGLVVGLLWIQEGDVQDAWNVPVWLSILAGLAAGPPLSAGIGVYQGLGCWGTAIVSIACGTLGGLIATYVLPIRPAKASRLS